MASREDWNKDKKMKQKATFSHIQHKLAERMRQKIENVQE